MKNLARLTITALLLALPLYAQHNGGAPAHGAAPSHSGNEHGVGGGHIPKRRTFMLKTTTGLGMTAGEATRIIISTIPGSTGNFPGRLARIIFGGSAAETGSGLLSADLSFR